MLLAQQRVGEWFAGAVVDGHPLRMADGLPKGSVPRVGIGTSVPYLVGLVVERPTTTALVLGDVKDLENFEGAGAVIGGKMPHHERVVAGIPSDGLAGTKKLLAHFTPPLVGLLLDTIFSVAYMIYICQIG